MKCSNRKSLLISPTNACYKDKDSNQKSGSIEIVHAVLQTEKPIPQKPATFLHMISGQYGPDDIIF